MAHRAKIAGGTGIPVKWNQGAPYYNECPVISNQHALTGCVATAFAQLMAYYKYPATHNGRTLHWDEMLKVCSSAANDIGKQDVAYLMSCIGQYVNMQYGLESSSAYMKDIKKAAQGFGYPYTGIYDHFNYEKVKNALDSNKPVIFSGRDSYDEGHAWVVDAYYDIWRYMYWNGNSKLIKYEYVYCNWGWGGFKDGYAVADVFDPYDTIKDPGDIMKSALDNDDEDSHDECDILCGKRPGVSPTAYCRKVHILTGLNP